MIFPIWLYPKYRPQFSWWTWARLAATFQCTGLAFNTNAARLISFGAVSTVAGRRWRNAPSLEGYLHAHALGGEPSRTREPLDADDLRRERWMLGLRLGRGMDMGWAGPPDHPEAMARLEAASLLVREDGAVALTREGRFVQNAILHELMEYA